MRRSLVPNRGGVGKLFLFGCLGLIVLFAGIGVLVLVLTGPQKKVVEAHLDAMRSKDVDAAFKQIDGQHITKEQVRTILELNPQVFSSSDTSFPSRRVVTENGQEKAEIMAKIKGTDGKDYSIQYVLLPSGEEWKIAGINSDDLALAPAAIVIGGVKVSQKKGEDGGTALKIEFEVAGCGSRPNGGKFDYDVVLKGKLVDAAGAVLVAEQELARYKQSVDTNVATVTGDFDFTLSPAVSGEVKATIIAEDTISGKGASQVVPVKIEK